jgi:hypothetical protein
MDMKKTKIGMIDVVDELIDATDMLKFMANVVMKTLDSGELPSDRLVNGMYKIFFCIEEKFENATSNIEKHAKFPGDE